MNFLKNIPGMAKRSSGIIYGDNTMKQEDTSYWASIICPGKRQLWLFLFLAVINLVITGNFLLPGNVAAEPLITSISTTPLDEGQTGVIIDGSGFSIAPIVYLTKLNDWDNRFHPNGDAVQIITGTPTDTQIAFTVVTCGLSDFTGPAQWDAYLWVVDDADVPSATGFPVELNNVFDNTPPTQSVFNYPDDDAFIGPNFSLYAGVYEQDSTGTGECYYSLDDGVTWNYYGSTPITPLLGIIQCSVSVTNAPDGPAGIKMMTCSTCGGCSETPTISRTIDALGPEQGDTFTVTRGSNDCTVEWSTTTDSGIGMHSTEPYEIYMQVPMSGEIGLSSTCGLGEGQRVYQGTEGTSYVHSPVTIGKDYYFKLCYKDNLNNVSLHSANPIKCGFPGMLLRNFTGNLQDVMVGPSAVDIPVGGFIIYTNEPPTTLTELVVDSLSSVTDTTSVSVVKLFRDDGSAQYEFDSSDTFIADTVFSPGTTEATFSNPDFEVLETWVRYFITYSISDHPIHLATLQGHVKSLVGALPYSGTDTPNSVITIDARAPSTSDDTPADWKNHEITVTLDPFTNGPVNTTTGIYGCFGSGCTPVVLGGTTMTTSCGAGNTCAFDVRYYSIDNYGNVESIKTAVNQAKVDTEPPVGGMFTATGDTNRILLEWSGFSDTGSVLNYYFRRSQGPTPPADCSSGTIYGGANTSYDDNTGLVNEQDYSYRLCVYDAAGNLNSDFTAGPATYREPCVSNIYCTDCHGTPPESGGHPMHTEEDQEIWCSECHNGGPWPAHITGKIQINPYSGWLGSNELDFPGPNPPGTCGSLSKPIGGNSSGGELGCHMGTPNYPLLTPDSECEWYGSCDPIAYSGCSTCHGVPVGRGDTGYEYNPGAHEIHIMTPDCSACHVESGSDPSHEDGFVNLNSAIGWHGSLSRPWPGPRELSCGGPENPIGCHNNLTSNPSITPEWECSWDAVPWCTSPSGP